MAGAAGGELADSYYKTGLARLQKGAHETAVDYFTEAIRINPRYAAAYSSRACAYAARGKYDAAIEDFSAVIRIEPRNPAAYSNWGFGALAITALFQR